MDVNINKENLHSEEKTKPKSMSKMHLIIDKERLLPLIAQVQGILEKRTVIPILANILIETGKDSINIYASDSELSFLGSLPAKVKKSGKAVINGKKLFEIVKELPSGEISLIEDSHYKIRITKDKSKFQIHGLNPSDFPVFPEIKVKKFQKFKVSDMEEVIDKTIYCVSLDESRYYLTGVFLEQVDDSLEQVDNSEQVDKKYRFVATDGHRMSFIDMPSGDYLDFEEGIIIPRKGLHEIRKILQSSSPNEDVEIGIDGPSLVFKFQKQVLIIRLIEGKYPDYKQLIPKEKGVEISLKREEFLSALKRVSVLVSARYKGIQFIFTKGQVKIQMIHPDVGEASEDIPCSYKGGELKIKFSSKYILDILSVLRGEKVKFILKDSTSPGILQDEKNLSYTTLVMPIKY